MSRLRQPHRSRQRIGLLLREHQRRQIKTRTQPVTHTGFTFNRYALVLQIGHVAVDGALGHLQPLGQEFSRAQASAADQLDELDELDEVEEAVGAAHGGRISLKECSLPRVNMAHTHLAQLYSAGSDFRRMVRSFSTLGANMGQKLSPPELALYRAVDEVLHYTWDPIGVSRMPQARDEYQSYLPQVFKLLQEKQSAETIANYLSMVATERMGLSMCKEHDLKIAQLLLDWKATIHEQN